MSSHVISPFLCREVCDQHRLPFLASSLHLALYSSAGAVTQHSIAGVLIELKFTHQGIISVGHGPLAWGGKKIRDVAVHF